MANPIFDLVWSSDRVDTRPISDANYAIGWNHLGSNNVLTDDHDYVMKMFDTKSQWLYEQIGYNDEANIVLSTDGFTTGINSSTFVTVLCNSDDSSINNSSYVFMVGCGGVVTNDVSNVAFIMCGARSPSTPSNAYGPNTNNVVAMASEFAECSESTFSTSMAISGGGHYLANCCVLMSSLDSAMGESNYSTVMSSNDSEVYGFDNVTILSSKSVVARKSHTLVMGHGASRDVSNITIELDAETGGAEFSGPVSVQSITVGGVLLEYEELVVELGGDFGVQEVLCTRVGKMVTISANSLLTHASATSASSSVGAIPLRFRANGLLRSNTSSIASPVADIMEVDVDGTLIMRYVDTTVGTAIARTTTLSGPSISYNTL